MTNDHELLSISTEGAYSDYKVKLRCKNSKYVVKSCRTNRSSILQGFFFCPNCGERLEIRLHVLDDETE